MERILLKCFHHFWLALGLKRHLMVVKRPFAHVANALRCDSVEDKLRIVDAAQVLPQQRIGVPDLLKNSSVANDFSYSSDANLVVMVVKIPQFHLGVGGDFLRLVIAKEVGNVDREPVGLTWRLLAFCPSPSMA
jgi:hypothetical protein